MPPASWILLHLRVPDNTAATNWEKVHKCTLSFGKLPSSYKPQKAFKTVWLEHAFVQGANLEVI